MNELIRKLEGLEGVHQRSLISLIRELNECISKAQSNGFKIASIHLEISKTVPVNLASFKTLLYRVRKQRRKTPTKPLEFRQEPATLSKPEEVKTTNTTFDKESATQRSKQKLAQFGKGK